MLSLSRLVADLEAKDGIRCNAISGPSLTAAWLAMGGLADQQGDRDAVSRRSAPGGRLAGRAPEEIAAVAVFRCSDRVLYVTGAAWGVDRGTVPYHRSDRIAAFPAPARRFFVLVPR